MLRFGLIGCGQHARWAVSKAMQASQRVRLVAVADLSQSSLDSFEYPDPQLRRYLDFREMLKKESLDAVYISTPCEAHAEPAMAALDKGCHVLCEKPMAMSLKDCQDMIDAAEKGKRLLVIDFENRYGPEYRTLHRWVSEGRLGQLHAIHMNEMWDGHKVFGPLADRRARFTDASGCLDCGIHYLDLARYFSGGGQWRDIHAAGVWFGEKRRFPPHIAVMATLDVGVLVTLNASFAYTAYIEPKDQSDSIVMVGTRGVIDFRKDKATGNSTAWLTSESLTETVQFDGHGHSAIIPLLLDDMDAVVHGEKERPASMALGEDGLMAQKIVLEANRQALERGDVGGGR